MFSKIFGTVTLPSSTSESMFPTQKAMLEIETYMQYPTLHIYQCELEWWKIEARMPVLLKVARKYLCICSSSIASERMFSKGGNIATAKRNSLKPKCDTSNVSCYKFKINKYHVFQRSHLSLFPLFLYALYCQLSYSLSS